MNYFFLFVKRFDLELLAWVTGLILLASLDLSSNHFSLCLLKNLGINFCPGCGLGHAIAYIFKGEWLASFQSHPLGIPALLIIFHRIFKLLHKQIKVFSHQKNI